jgi:TatD DNase family protein
MGLVDFHCHLDLYPNFERIVSETEDLGIFTLAVTTTPRAWERNNLVALRTKHVRAALGLHPQLVGEHWGEIDQWEMHLKETRYVGEVGLDAGPNFFKSFDRQKEVFSRILRCCAREGGKILSIHSIRAASAVLDAIERELPLDRGVPVLHWFTGSKAEAERAVEMGCFFSVNAQMLRHDRGRKLVALFPDEQILTETDGPFTSAGGNPATPRDVGGVHLALAETKGWTAEASERQVFRNLKRLLEATADRRVNPAI